MLWGLCRIGQLICFRACHSLFEFDNRIQSMCTKSSKSSLLAVNSQPRVLWSSFVRVTLLQGCQKNCWRSCWKSTSYSQSLSHSARNENRKDELENVGSLVPSFVGSFRSFVHPTVLYSTVNSCIHVFACPLIYLFIFIHHVTHPTLPGTV